MTPTDSRPFSETKYFDGYKSIRNRLRKYDPVELIKLCLEYLHAPFKADLDYVQRQPWLVLLLIKWILVDENAFTRGRPKPSKQQTHILLQSMLDLGDRVRLPTQYDHYRLFFRATAYQQFIYQRDTSILSIGRQFFYFNAFPDDHFIKKAFAASTGLELQRFLELSQVLLVRFLTLRENTVDLGWFSSLDGAYSTGEVKAFLDALSTTLEHARTSFLSRDAYYREREMPPRNSAEYVEQTPFLSFPLLRLGNQYVCIERHVFFRCIESFIYNRLKAYDPGRFMGHFGPAFERYVEKAIEYTGLRYVTEKQIECALDKKQRPSLIDFLIAEDDANIFIDAKGVEMAYQGKVTHDSDELARCLETSALKAISQAHSTIAELSQESGSQVMRRRPRNYMIVVTYSEMYVGNGTVLSELLGPQKVKDALDKYAADLQIPLENMYFMTIQEFEHLAAAVHEGEIGLADSLDRAKKADADPKTSTFDFQQHLDGWKVGRMIPEYLKKRSIDEIHKIADHLRRQ